MAWSKMYILSLSFLDFFCEQFNYITGFEKKIQLLQHCIFLADSKRRPYELSNDVSFVIFGHPNMGFRACPGF